MPFGVAPRKVPVPCRLPDHSMRQMVSASALFFTPDVRKVRLRFPCGCQVLPGESAGTWILDRVRVDLHVASSGEPIVTHENGHRFFVRPDSAAASGYRIYRWESPGPDRPPSSKRRGHDRLPQEPCGG